MNTITPTIGQLKMLASLRGNQWSIREDRIVTFALSALEASEVSDKAREDSYYEDRFDMRIPAYIDADKIAHVEIKGALMDSCPAIYERLGLATRYQTLITECQGAINQGAVGILFHTNSPGGTVTGNIEASTFIAELPVPSVAHCSSLACSAAYKLIAGTMAIVASPSAEVGNIGTILAWDDCTEFWKEMGIEFKALVSAGATLKSTFHLEPNEEQIAFLQEGVDAAGEQFRNHVSTYRQRAGAEVDAEVWKAGWYSGQRAGSLGLIDDIGCADDARKLLISMIGS